MKKKFVKNQPEVNKTTQEKQIEEKILKPKTMCKPIGANKAIYTRTAYVSFLIN